MNKSINRFLNIELPKSQSLFLWGARKTGKSTYLHQRFPQSICIDLLKHDTFLKYSANPSALREEALGWTAEQKEHPIIIDEIQKIPELLDEVHWMIENIQNVSFILCGSSMRRIKHSGANLLGGRAWRRNFLPLCYPEFEQFDLLKILNYGLIPDHFLSKIIPTDSLRGYIVDYIIPEIQWEGRIRNLGAFNRFLDAIAFSNAEMINYSNISRECSVSAKIVQSYVDLLQEMMLGYLIFPYTKSISRALITKTPKFYFFDTAIPNAILNKTISQIKGAEAGHSFEHYIFLELLAYRELNTKYYPINYWHTKTGLEVDFILDRGRIAVEVKISDFVHKTELKGLVAFAEEHNPEKSIVVSLDKNTRIVDIGGAQITIYPVEVFLSLLWKGAIV